MTGPTEEKHAYHDTAHLDGDVKGRTARGGTATVAGQGLVFACQLLGLITLARLLPPSVHGLVAMATACTGFLALFKDLGLNMATIQRREISDAQISGLFWINLLLGLGAAGLVAAAAPLLAWVTGQEELLGITLVLAAAFFFYGLGAQHLALLKRRMRFGRLALIELVATLLGVGGAITAAVAGAGYWALVTQPLLIAVTTAVGAWWACPWRPSRPGFGAPLKELLGFGGNIVGHDLLNYTFRNLDDILVYCVAGKHVLGLYEKAYRLATLPMKLINAPLSKVTVSGLSLLQDKPTEYRHYYLLAVRYIAFATMPIFALLIFLAPQVITLLLGPRWIEAGDFFRILALGTLFQPITNTTGWLFISSGRSREMLRWQAATIGIPITFYLVGAWVMGARGVAWGHALSALLLIAPCIRYACRGTPIDTWAVFRATLHPLVASLSAGFLTWLAWHRWHSWGIALPLMALAYLAGSCLLSRNLTPITNLNEILQQYILKKKS